MKILLTLFLFTPFISNSLSAQQLIDSINKKEITRIINYLASDKLKGRFNGSPEQVEAAHFLSNEFSSYGIDTIPGFKHYFHEFPAMVNSRSVILSNVIGMIKGRSKPGEIVIISAHYDHVNSGIDGLADPFDSIYNGANDNASGTTAVLMLAKYYGMRKDNERTIFFCLFSGEELGLLGSKAFANKLAKDTVKAVINIEMIGHTNWSGKNAFVVCGTSYTTIDEIMKKNLAGTSVKVRNDFSDTRNLYQRSDNYSFALKWMPAVTIMCSNDDDPCYHKPCDEAKRIDINNMVKVIQAIAKGSASIISGEDTPAITRE